MPRERSQATTRRFRSVRPIAALAIALAAAWVGVGVVNLHAQLPVPTSSQFDMTGFIQAATLDASCQTDQHCGGTITINNQVIVVPKNTILQMPAAALSWQQVFANAPAPYGLPSAGTTLPAQSGLASGDLPKPANNYEAHVVGNRVKDASGDHYIAGLMFLSQHSLQSGQGYINFINYATGEFEVGGTVGTSGTGQRVKINDPQGRFAPAWQVDTRFTIDENNPTVRAGTGYPMCIPKTGTQAGDLACPESNRPNSAGVYQSIFTMSSPYAAGTTGPADPMIMAPFEVGDYVDYSGIIDPTDAARIAAFQVIGNVGIFTQPGTDPAYVVTEVMLLGVGGLTAPGATEATVRTRFEGFSTDPSRNILLWGIDVDCAGNEAPRDWGSIDVDQGPPLGAVMGRWRFRPPSKVLTMPAAGTFLPATREMRSTIAGAVQVKTANGLTAGQYQAPIFEFLFPENAAVGSPIVDNNFQDMPFLATGALSGVSGGFGVLSPWPGNAALLTATPCSSISPNPNPTPAGVPTVTASWAPQPVFIFNMVNLNAALTDIANATFAWTVTDPGGKAVPLNNATSASPSFGMFQSSLKGSYAYRVTVTGTDAATGAAVSLSANGTASVSDKIDGTPAILKSEYRISKQRLIVNALPTDPTSTLYCMPLDSQGRYMWASPAQMVTAVGTAGVIIDIVGVAQPTNVLVFSSKGGNVRTGITLRQ